MKKKTKVYIVWDFGKGIPVFSENSCGSLLVFFTYEQATNAAKRASEGVQEFILTS